MSMELLLFLSIGESVEANAHTDESGISATGRAFAHASHRISVLIEEPDTIPYLFMEEEKSVVNDGLQ